MCSSDLFPSHDRSGSDKVTGKIIPASGVIIDKKRGKVHIINPGKIRNIAQGFFDQSGTFHPIRASGDYDSSRVGESKKKKKLIQISNTC